MNALKHGILSKELYFSTGKDYLSYEQFLELQIAFFESMEPVGILETLLVDRLFATFWRIQRLYIAETGSIRKQVEAHFMQNSLDQIEENATARKDVEHGFFRRMRTSHGCEQLAMNWQSIYETIKESGLPLGKGMARALDEELGGRSGFWKAECVSICNYAFENVEEKPMDAEEEKQILGWALQYSEEMMELFNDFAKFHKGDEEDVRKADFQSKMLPPIADLEKYQKYEAHLQRILMQTLHELQRVQSTRLGKPAPLSAALDVNLNSENGFVS